VLSVQFVRVETGHGFPLVYPCRNLSSVICE